MEKNPRPLTFCLSWLIISKSFASFDIFALFIRRNEISNRNESSRKKIYKRRICMNFHLDVGLATEIRLKSDLKTLDKAVKIEGKSDATLRSEVRRFFGLRKV